MSMRLVKQQLAALSSKTSSGSAGVEEGKIVKKDPKNRTRKRKKDSSLAVKQTKKESKIGLTEEEIKAANLEYLRKSQPAEKSVELMSKVAHQTQLITQSLLLDPLGAGHNNKPSSGLQALESYLASKSGKPSGAK